MGRSVLELDIAMQLLINVGGKGRRMGALTKEVPKPMIPLCGKPILEHLLEWAKRNHFDEIVLLCGYKHEVIQSYFRNGDKFGIKIVYSIEKEPLGSGGPVKYAEPLLDGTFAYISGDLFCKVDFLKMLEYHKKSNAVMTVLLHETDHPEDSDILQVNENNEVIRFVSKHDDHKNAGNLGNAGLCIMELDTLNFMKKKVFTLETYLYPELLKSGEKVQAYITDEIISDIGTPERLKKIAEIIKKEEDA